MKKSSKEPEYLFDLQTISAKSPIAASFLSKRNEENKAVDSADNKLLKRIYNVDHNAYLEGGALNAKMKELMGLVASASLRCDDCIFYHVIQCFRLGASQNEVHEALNVATVVGGTIVIPHLRRAYTLLAELYSE